MNLIMLSHLHFSGVLFQGTADEVVDCSHGKQLWELCKQKYDPVWINGGGHCNLELYPEYIKQLKKFVISLSKMKTSSANTTTTAAAAAMIPSSESTTDTAQSKPTEGSTSDTLELAPSVLEVSRNSLDSRLEKSKKSSSSKPEKSRMSTDQVDRFRRIKGLVW